MTLARALLSCVAIALLLRVAWPADAGQVQPRPPINVKGTVELPPSPGKGVHDELAPTTTSSVLVPAINRLRAQTGAPPLTVTWPLEWAAMRRAQLVVAGGVLAHDDFWETIDAAGVPTSADTAEVLAYDDAGPLDSSAARLAAVSWWQGSPEHHAILHDPRYRYIGTAELPWEGWDNGRWIPASQHQVLYIADLAS